MKTVQQENEIKCNVKTKTLSLLLKQILVIFYCIENVLIKVLWHLFMKILRSFQNRFTFNGKRSICFEIKRMHSLTCSIPCAISYDILIFLFGLYSFDFRPCIAVWDRRKQNKNLIFTIFINNNNNYCLTKKHFGFFSVIKYYTLTDHHFFNSKRLRRPVWKERSITFELSSYTAAKLFFNILWCEQLFVHKMASSINL